MATDNGYLESRVQREKRISHAAAEVSEESRSQRFEAILASARLLHPHPLGSAAALGERPR
jgi:hypothetical protein